MSFIRFQNIQKDVDGHIVKGSATIMNTVYDKDRTHKSRQEVVEKLGKVIWMAEGGKSGVFVSPSRGLVEYDSSTGVFKEVSKDDPRTAHFAFPEPPRNVEFGTLDLFLSFAKKSGFTSLLKAVFSEKRDFERAIAHIYHVVMRCGSRVTCDDFVFKTFLPFLFQSLPVSSFGNDCYYYNMMGDDRVKEAFFKAYASMMRKKDPDFGKACLVDSTPLATDAKGIPLSAISCHGTGCGCAQMRMILVLDKTSLMPLWFKLIAGNVIDVNTLEGIKLEILEILDIVIEDYTLDAGYCSEALIKDFCPEVPSKEPESTVLVRMPGRKGYPLRTLFSKSKNAFSDPRRTFVYEGHTYFGDKARVELFGRKPWCYIYLDRENADDCYRHFLEETNEKDRSAMMLKDLYWEQYKGGFFVLISNIDGEPRDILSRYFERCDIESFFKTIKDQDLLPLSKRTFESLKGTVLNCIISNIIFLGLRKKANEGKLSTTKLIGVLQSSMCLMRANGQVVPDYPTKQVKEVWKMFDRDTNRVLTLDGLRDEYGLSGNNATETSKRMKRYHKV